MFRIFAAVVLVIAAFFVYISMTDPAPVASAPPKSVSVVLESQEETLDAVAAELDSLEALDDAPEETPADEPETEQEPTGPAPEGEEPGR